VSESSGYTYTYSMAHIMLMQSIEWKLDEKHLLIVWPICRKETRTGCTKCIYSKGNKKKKLHVHL